MAETSKSEQTLALKGKTFLLELHKLSQRRDVNIAATGVKISLANLPLTKVGKLNPKEAGVVITAVMVKKAMLATGLATTNEAADCVAAVSRLGASIAIAGVTAPAGFPLFVTLVSVALEGYNTGTACFVKTGVVSHALRAAD